MRNLAKSMLAAGLMVLGVGLGGRAGALEVGPSTAPRLGANLGGGFNDFTGALGSHTNGGISWSFRAAYQVAPYVGVEMSYLGAHNGIDDVRLPTSQGITTTSFTGDLKLSADVTPTPTQRYVLEPYLFAGAGGAYFGVSGDNHAIYASDSNVQFPMGAGADAFVTDIVTVGARWSYIFNIQNKISDETTNGNQFSVIGTLGVQY